MDLCYTVHCDPCERVVEIDLAKCHLTESLSACRYSPSPTRPSHRSGPGSSPRQHIKNPTERIGVDVTLDPETTPTAKLDRDDACFLARPVDRRRLGRDRWRWELDSLHRNELRDGRCSDPAQLFTPMEKLAHMDAGRSGDLRNTRPRFERRCNEPYLVLPRLPPAALD